MATRQVITEAHRRRFERLREYGCVCCRIAGLLGCGQVEIHHIVDNGYRRLSGGHDATLPLGIWHHRGVLPEGFNIISATEAFGPSLAHGSKPFHARWGSQRELLAKLNTEIGETLSLQQGGPADCAAATIDDVGRRILAQRVAQPTRRMSKLRSKLVARP